MMKGWAMMLTLTSLTALAAHGADPVPRHVELLSFAAEGDEGIILQGELCLPHRPSAEAKVPGVVICHPNPQMGGTMENVIVRALRDRLVDMGIATLRFNFRGVGGSQGQFDEGIGEVNDVLGALAELRARPQVDAQRCGIVGYSFGAEMGLKAAARVADLPAYAGVGFPTGLEQVNPEDFAYVADVRAKMLFVTGTEDQYSSVTEVLRIVTHFGKDAQVVPLEGADHFFVAAGTLGTMTQLVADFIAAHLIGEL